MSWDIYVQDIPDDVMSVEDMPDGFLPRPLGRRSDVLAGIRRAAPDIRFADDQWGSIEGPGYSVEVNIGSRDPIQSVALHVYGGDQSVYLVHDILAALNARAFDPSNPSGIFSLPESADGFRRWREYRATVLESK
ncbi:MAG: hypothetical protein HKN72_12525 [Gemmatimonadetes bacterium]|nr:hypothetical protein [Gemmatimonadota bacterium]